LSPSSSLPLLAIKILIHLQRGLSAIAELLVVVSEHRETVQIICVVVLCYCNGFATTKWPNISENTYGRLRLHDYQFNDFKLHYTAGTVHIW